MKRKSILVTVFVLVIALASFAFAGGGTSNEASTSTDVSSQNTNFLIGGTQGFSVQSTDNSKTNVIGSFPETNGLGVNAPQIPLDALLILNQWNEAGFREVFGSFPEIVTIDNIATAIADRKEQSKKEKGIVPYEKIEKMILKDRILFNKFPASMRIQPVPYLNLNEKYGMEEGTDYVIITPLTFVAKKTEVSKDWIGLAMCKKGMELGGDLIIPTGEGAERVFKNKASLLSFLTSFAGAAAEKSANFYGANVSPGFSLGGGQNSTKSLPFLRAKVIKILNWEKINHPKKEETKIENCDEIREEIRKYQELVNGCTRFCYNNLTYRSPLGDLYIDLYLCTGYKFYLKEAIEQYEIAERNSRKGYDIKQHQAEAEKIMAQVYYNWSGCIYILQGEDAAMNFAAEKNLERICTGFTN